MIDAIGQSGAASTNEHKGKLGEEGLGRKICLEDVEFSCHQKVLIYLFIYYS